jgi:hypothetical protein
MKVGILTFQRAINYGAVLQAYALQETLESIGHEVQIINYLQPRVEKTDRRPFEKNGKIDLLKGLHLRSFINFNKNKRETLERRSRFDGFLSNYLHLTKPCTYNEIPSDFDLYVIGSDQVWNSRICGGIDEVFWGNFSKNKNAKVISFSASTSVKDIMNIDKKQLQKYLNNFNGISTRENDVADYLNSNFSLYEPAQVVIDPTLLANPSIWDKLVKDKIKDIDPYVLYFGARFYSKNPLVLKQHAEKIAKAKGYGVKTIDFNHDTPIDFVNKFRNASFVVTSSFHGVAFSLIFNRPLNAILYGDEQDCRYENLLRTIGAEDMLIPVGEEFKSLSYDYATINQSLSKLRNTSIAYLNNF